MTNYERYRDWVLSEIVNGNPNCEMRQLQLYDGSCYGNTCRNCSKQFVEFLKAEYVADITETDWSNIAIDTPVFTSDDGVKWYNGHFARYENGRVYTWAKGRTSCTTNDTMAWKYVKLDF